MPSIRPRNPKNRSQKVKVRVDGSVKEVNVYLNFNYRKPGVGFMHPTLEAIVAAALRQGYIAKKGGLDVKKLARDAGIAWRQLYYSLRGANVSLRAMQQLADVVGLEIVTRRRRK
jgi:DNA-binding phage protein